VALERGPLSFVGTVDELLEGNNSDSGLENREYGSGGPLRFPRGTLYPQKLAQTSPTSGGRSIGIVTLRTKVAFGFVVSDEYTSSIFRVEHGGSTCTAECWHPSRGNVATLATGPSQRKEQVSLKNVFSDVA
jgi:hypothetical protein